MPDRIRTHVRNWDEARQTLDAINRVLQALQTSDMSDVSRTVSPSEYYILAWNPATGIYEPQSGGDATHLLTAPNVYYDYTARAASWEWAPGDPPTAIDLAFDYLADAVVLVTGEHAMTASLVSELITGTAPFIIASTTVCANLNADLLDGNHAAAFAVAAHTHTLPDLTDVTSATQTDGFVLHSTGGNYAGAQLTHTKLGDIGSNTHAQVDTHIAAANPHSGSGYRKKTKVFYIEDPASGGTYPVMRTHTDVPITITKVFAECDAGSPDIHLWWRAPDAQFAGGTQILTAVLTADPTEADTTSFADATIPGARSIWCEVDDADTATKILVTIEYTED